MTTHRVTFPGSTGALLAARLDAPEGPQRACALFAHCFTCSKDIFAATRIAQRLVEHGIAVLRFDFTGLGHSEGEFANTNFSSNVADLGAAADWLRTQGHAPTLLIGHSLGGAAVLAATRTIGQVRAVATLGAPSDPSHVSGLFQDQVPQIQADGQALVHLAGRPFHIQHQFLLDAAEHNLSRRIAEMDCALLVLHSPADQTVAIDNATRIFASARQSRSFVSLDGADHLLTRHADAAYAANMIAAWSERYF